MPSPPFACPDTNAGIAESSLILEWVDIYFTKMTNTVKDMFNKAFVTASKSYPNLKIQKKLVEGTPEEEIIKEAREGGFDLIVLGSHGMGKFEELILSSVSTIVVQESTVSVLIKK